MKRFCVYMLSNNRVSPIYIGVTSNLLKRVYEHKNELAKGFSEKYKIKKLVYYEVHEEAEQAILREKQMKKWYREWKINLIEKNNPDWRDLYEDLSL